jgi:hypothetical protein
VDPITQTLFEYDQYLRGGGEPADLSRFPSEPHVKEKKLHASALLLCDRRAAFDVMEDLGLIEADITHPPELLLDFRVGNHMEEFVAQAMQWKGVLQGYQTRLSNHKRKGRLDLEIDPAPLLGTNGDTPNWIVEIKFIKTNKAYVLRKYFPKAYHIAQAETYRELSGRRVAPVLFYALRTTFQTALYSWRWEGDDAVIQVWDGEHGWTYHDTMAGLKQDIEASKAAQERWLHTGELPPRVGRTPDEHPFLCVDKGSKRGWGVPTCQFFARCWGRDPEPFRLGGWDE